MADIPDAILVAAAAEIVRTDEWFPKVARIRAVAERVASEAQKALPTAPTPAERAWGNLCGGVADDEAGRVVETLGGWGGGVRWIDFLAEWNRQRDPSLRAPALLAMAV